MEKDIRGELFQSVMDFAREKHAEQIDTAYEYFWEEEDPEDFLGGTAMGLAFINFEDWFVCDWRNEDGRSIIDLYIEASEGLLEDNIKALNAMKDSYISVYEVVSVDGGVKLKDLLLGEEFTTRNETLKTLGAGDIFASRFVALDGERVMSRCVYPYNKEGKDRLLGYADRNLKRYKKNKKPEGTVRDFLKDESYICNVLWIDNIFKSRQKN